MLDIFAEIGPALALALTAIVAVGVLIVGIALAFKAIDIATGVISLAGGSQVREKDRVTDEYLREFYDDYDGYTAWLERNK